MSGMQMRPLTRADIPFAMELKNIAGWNQTEEDWESYLRYDEEGCFLAEMNGRKAGTATTISYQKRFGWIGMVLVHPSVRGGGIGTALLNESIHYLQAQGTETIKLDATAMGRRVYVPLGFQDEYEVRRYESRPGRRLVNPLREDAGALRPMSIGVLAAIARFDACCFGAVRADVLQTLWKRSEGKSYYVEAEGETAGYIMGRQGHEAYQIGPWAAKDERTAELLFTRMLDEIGDTRVFFDVPVPNADGIQLAEKYGFQVQRTFSRMYLGKNEYPGSPDKVYGTSGAEKG